MSKLDDLINKLCPDGVEYKKIEELTKSICTGLNPRNNFRLNTDDASNYYVTVKEFTTGKIKFTEKTDRISKEAYSIIQKRSNLEKGDVLLSGIGTIGKVALVDIPTDNFNCSESVYLIKLYDTLINPKFFIHILRSEKIQAYFYSTSRGSTLKGIRMQDLKSLEIPVPPLEIQNEIVQILDKFTSLEAELEAELEARRKQYEYYRDSLLTFCDDVEWSTLGDNAIVTKLAGFEFTEHVKYQDSGEIIALRGLNVKKGHLVLDDVKYIDGSNFDKLKRSKLYINDMLFTYVGTVGQVALIDKNDKYYLAPNVALIRFQNQKINPEFMKFYFQTYHFQKLQIDKYSGSSSMKNLTMENIRKFSIPIPDMDLQNKVVRILSNFELLTESITSGLPAEIEARHKQYEYYRDKLLTFKRKEA